MPTLKQALLVMALVVSPFALGSAASASTTDCTIEGTGPGSDNVCEIVQNYTCTIDGNSVFIVNNSNDQDVYSGDATVGGGTDSGDVVTGTATNENGVSIEFAITGDDTCEVVSATTPTPPVEEEEVKETVPAPEKEAPPVLATTSGASVVAVVAAVLGVAVVVVVGLKLAAAYVGRR